MALELVLKAHKTMTLLLGLLKKSSINKFIIYLEFFIIREFYRVILQKVQMIKPMPLLLVKKQLMSI